jgi:ferredoxin
MKRQIIQIDEEKCTGCGLCIPGCPEGAIQLIDGKARLVSDLFCDGLGACLGHCPEGAITIEEREAEKYDERRVMENIIKAGPGTIRAHLAHLDQHDQKDYYDQAIHILYEKGISMTENEHAHSHTGGCPGSQSRSFQQPHAKNPAQQSQLSALTHWPIQMHLMSPSAPHFRNSDVVLAADCVAFSMGNFHSHFLAGITLTIACPKLDDGKEIYIEKLKALIEEAKINTLTVIIMQVPCCGGLLHLAQTAAEQAQRKVPIKAIVISLQGDILREEWLS